VNIEEYRLNGGSQNSIGSVPDKAFRSGDLSGLLDAQGNQIPIYDPNTTIASGNGFTRSVFPGNIIPANRISNASKNILSYVPEPTLSSVYNNYPSTGSSITNYGAYTFKADHYFTSTQHLSGTW